MGEQKEAPKNDGAKKDDGVVTVVLKMELHCEGCAKKVRRAVRHYEGVQSVKTDFDANKVTVVGKVDPVKMKERLEEKTKKKVELISPQPKKDAAAGGGDKKPEEKKAKENKPPKESTVVLKIGLDCDACISKFKKAVKKIDGVDNVTVDNGHGFVTVKETMVVTMVRHLKDQLKRNVEIVPAKKDDRGEKKDAKADDRDKKKDVKTDDGDKKKDVKADEGKKKDAKADDGGKKKEKKDVKTDDEDKKKDVKADGGKRKNAKIDGGKKKDFKAHGGAGKGEKKDREADGGKKKDAKADGGGGEKKDKEGAGKPEKGREEKFVHQVELAAEFKLTFRIVGP